MIINTNKSGIENLLDLINMTNSTTITQNDVLVSVPNLVSASSDPSVKNTEVTLTALINGNYDGVKTVSYHRLYLDLIMVETIYRCSPETTLEEIKGVLCTQYDLIPDEVAFVETTLPTVDETHPTITLRAKNNSYVYVGESPVVLVPAA